MSVFKFLPLARFPTRKESREEVEEAVQAKNSEERKEAVEQEKHAEKIEDEKLVDKSLPCQGSENSMCALILHTSRFQSTWGKKKKTR